MWRDLDAFIRQDNQKYQTVKIYQTLERKEKFDTERRKEKETLLKHPENMKKIKLYIDEVIEK